MGKEIKLTPDEAYMHLQYVVIPKVYSKTDRDKEALKMALEGLKLLEEKHELVDKEQADNIFKSMAH